MFYLKFFRELAKISLIPLVISLGFIHITRAEPNSSLFLLEVPFRYQIWSYYCGPACLEMVFAYYGPDISQNEIADVARTDWAYWGTSTDDMRRAGHFSNLSISVGREMPGNITGYSLRDLGYAAFEIHDMTIDDVKASIRNGIPPILLMWQDESHAAGHYRVAIGYNDTHIVFHDPWNKAMWGGRYGGPNTIFNYSTIMDLWSYSGYWGMITYPWQVELSCPTEIHRNQTFTVTANITYPCPYPFNITGEYPASSVNATIILPSGLVLESGENAAKPIGSMEPGQSVMVSWLVKAVNSGDFIITVQAAGKISGSVFPNEIYPGYEYIDRIGGFGNCILHIIGFVHDVAVVEVSTLGNLAGYGFQRWIFLSFANQGEFDENFTVVIYANVTPIATETVILERGCLANSTINSEPLNLAKGKYSIWAYIEPVSEEEDLDDNTYINGWLFVVTPGDVNGDDNVNILDCILIANHFGHVEGDNHIQGSIEWNSCMNCDVNGDLKVNILDCIILSNNFR